MIKKLACFVIAFVLMLNLLFPVGVNAAGEGTIVFSKFFGASGSGNGQFSTGSPTRMEIDAEGNFYLCDVNNNRIQKFDSNGNYVSSFGIQETQSSDQYTNGAFITVAGIAVDNSGDIYVVDSGKHNVQKFKNSGSHLLTQGTYSSTPYDSTYYNPGDIAFDPHGFIYVVETGGKRVQKFDLNMLYLGQWSIGGAYISNSSIYCDSLGNVYVTVGTKTVVKYDGSGNVLLNFTDEENLSTAKGVSTDAAGNIYVADTSGKLVKYSSAGVFIEKYNVAGINDVRVTSDGTIYVTSTSDCGVFKARPTSSNADLRSLTVTGAALSPVFSADTTSYSINVSENVDSISITPTVDDANSKIKIDNNSHVSGQPKTFNLGYGTAMFKINVTAEDSTQKEYVLQITRNNPSGTYLSYSTESGSYDGSLYYNYEDDYVGWYENIHAYAALKFDLGGYAGDETTFGAASLNFVYSMVNNTSYTGDFEISVYGSADDSWKEGESMPMPESYITTIVSNDTKITMSGTAKKTIDITDFVKDQIKNDAAKMLTFVIKGPANNPIEDATEEYPELDLYINSDEDRTVLNNYYMAPYIEIVQKSAPKGVTTDPAESVALRSAVIKGNVASDCGDSITEKGVEYWTSEEPASKYKSTDGTGTGAISVTLTTLTPDTDYHARAYAINGYGTSYGDEISFKTEASPSITGITPPLNGMYPAGTDLDFTAAFSSEVNVYDNAGAHKPYIPITLNTGGTARAYYQSGSGTATVIFRYTVEEGQEDNDGITLISPVNLNEGTIKDTEDNSINAMLVFKAPSTSGVIVDGIDPYITLVGSTNADGLYKAGDSINITVNFNENVTVTGTPKLTLETGETDRMANYESGSGGNALTFLYTVQEGDICEDLDYVSSTALSLNSGTIRDIAGNNAVLTIAEPGEANSLSSGKAIEIDAVAPLGYTVSIDQTVINNTNKNALSFTLAGAETGAAFNYVISSSGGGSNITGSGIASSAVYQETGIDVSSLPDGTLTLSVTLTDLAGNTGAVATDNSEKDTTAPTGGTITINNGAQYTNTTAVTLNLSAIGASHMMVSESSSFTGAGYEDYSENKAFALSSGDGIKTVYVKYRDAVGNETSGTVSSSITLDTVAPALQISSPSVPVTTGSNVTFTVTYTGADTITLSDTNIIINETGLIGSTVYASVSGTGNTRTVTINAISGEGSIGISIVGGTASDAAGNIAPPAGPSETFGADSAGPVLVISPPSSAITTGGSLTYTVTYVGADTITLANGDVTLEKTGSADGIIYVSGAGTSERIITISDITGNGTLGITIAVGTASDNAGNTAPAAGPSAVAIIDNIAPAGTMKINNDDQYCTSLAVLLFMSDDDGSGTGVSHMRFSDNGTVWTDWESAISIKSYTLTGPFGINTVYVQFRDIAGNISGIISDSIIYKSQPVAVAKTIKGKLNTILAFSSSDFVYSNCDGTDLDSVNISVLPANGLLKLNDTAITAGQIISAADLGGITFIPDAGWKGKTTFKWTAYDGVMWSEEAIMTIDFTPDNENNNSGNSSDNNNNGTNTQPASTLKVTASDNTTTVTAIVEAEVDNSGRAVASFTQAQINNAISKAAEEAAKGIGMTSVIEIEVNTSEDVDSVEVTIQKAAVDAAANSDVSELSVSTNIATITFDNEAMDAISEQAASDIKISVAKADVETLDEEAKQLVGDRPVYNFSVTSANKTISQFTGNVSVSLPYTPKLDEDINAIVIFFINADGNPEIVSNCRYDPETHTISFITDHFSKYAVGYNRVSFKDVPANSWYSEAVGFIAARSITAGTGNGSYSPDAVLTRGELLVMMMRAYSIAPDENVDDNFKDAGNTYYSGYLAAAKRMGISSGTGNNMFEPDKQITRQEMFTLLYNTLKAANQLPEGTSGKQMSDFRDADEIAAWAKDAVMLLVKAEAINGSNGRLNPEATATRAEMAQILYNLLSKQYGTAN